MTFVFAALGFATLRFAVAPTGSLALGLAFAALGLAAFATVGAFAATKSTVIGGMARNGGTFVVNISLDSRAVGFTFPCIDHKKKGGS